MRYWSMDAGAAQRLLKLRRESQEPALNGFQVQKGDGEDYPLAEISKLHAELTKLKSQYPDELGQRSREGGRFEAQACELVHRLLPFNAQVFSDPGFWTWLAVAKLSDIVEWRHGSKARHVKVANYGVGDKVENLFFRMWLRAEIAKDPEDKDPYRFARIEDQDLWRSHILRPGWTNAREVAKALIKLQADEAKRLSTDGVRELAKRLRRLRANVVFEVLDARRAARVVTEQAHGLPLASAAN